MWPSISTDILVEACDAPSGIRWKFQRSDGFARAELVQQLVKGRLRLLL